MDAVHSPVSFRKPQVVNGGSNKTAGGSNLSATVPAAGGVEDTRGPTEMISARKPPRKKQTSSRHCHNNLYGVLDDQVIKGSVKGRKEWCQKVRGEWGQRSSSLSPSLVRHQTTSSAPTSPSASKWNVRVDPYEVGGDRGL